MIRTAEPRDVPDLLAMVVELATYEREPDAVEMTEEQLHDALFGTDPGFRCFVACPDGDPATTVGMALWFRTMSTWTGRPGLWLEDLYVRPEHRGAGHGRALLAALAAHAVAHDFRRLEWAVLDWNEPALGFYRALGAVGQQEWTTHRLTGPALAALAGESAPAAAAGGGR